MLEKDLEKKCCRIAQQHGWLVHPKVGSHARGWPDRTFSRVIGDAFYELIFVEFKRPGAKPTRLQNHVADQLRERDYAVHVIDNVEDAQSLFDR